MLGDEAAESLGEEASAGVERRKHPNGLNDQAKKRLGLHLRAMYDTMANQPVPDRFKDLIARLDDAPPALDEA